MIEFRQIQVNQLLALVKSPEYARWKYVPISLARAQSHAHNPRALPDDTALILAVDEDQLVGYLGLLPDHFFGASGTVRGAWLSTLWIDPQQRGHGVAKQFLQQAFNAYNNCIAVTRFTKEAEQLYKRSGRFTWPEPQDGMRGYLRMNLRHLLPSRYPKTRRLKVLWAVVDALGNVVLDARIRLWLQARRPSGRCDYTHKIDMSMQALIPASRVVLQRGVTEINWILQYPWLHEGSRDRRYHFSSADPMFKTTILRLFDDTNTLLGFALLHIRNRNVQVPYYFVQNDQVGRLASAIGREMARHKWSTITVIDPALASSVRRYAPFWLRRKHLRRYIFSHELWSQLGVAPNLNVQDGSADAAWT